MVREIRENRSKFFKVKCPDCENEQTVFEKASTVVKCVVGHDLALPTGKASIKAEILSESSEASHAGQRMATGIKTGCLHCRMSRTS